MDMKTLWELRQKDPVPNSNSMTYVPQGRDGQKRQFESSTTWALNRQRHTRSDLSPIHKYRSNVLTSHAIGWKQEEGQGPPLQSSQHAMRYSEVTKTFENMVASNMAICLRS